MNVTLVFLLFMSFQVQSGKSLAHQEEMKVICHLRYSAARPRAHLFLLSTFYQWGTDDETSFRQEKMTNRCAAHPFPLLLSKASNTFFSVFFVRFDRSCASVNEQDVGDVLVRLLHFSLLTRLSSVPICCLIRQSKLSDELKDRNHSTKTNWIRSSADE